MNIAEKIEKDFLQAYKEKAQDIVSILRVVKAQLKNKRIELGKDLTDDDIIAVLRSQTKQIKEALEQFRQGGRDDLAGSAEREIEIIDSYLPKMMDESEVEKIVADVISKMGSVSKSDMGKVMGSVMGVLKGKADGTVVKKAVEKLLV
ncbi:MAG: hypothetical protein ACD_76C00155G0003 [uncultured bacterium]|nr:MAG: hypothetical protein ACD_76C00155G0003 [uncultured bacterium]HBD05609.1 hypothetical protein [Candidatus Uhrbacteria bacterium]